jgi:hypothetical protein
MPMLPGTLRTSSPTCLAIPAVGRRQPSLKVSAEVERPVASANGLSLAQIVGLSCQLVR